MGFLLALLPVFASFTYKTGTPLGRLASLTPAHSAPGLKVTQHLPSAGDLGDAAEKTTLQSSGVSLSPKKQVTPPRKPWPGFPQFLLQGQGPLEQKLGCGRGEDKMESERDRDREEERERERDAGVVGWYYVFLRNPRARRGHAGATTNFYFLLSGQRVLLFTT